MKRLTMMLTLLLISVIGVCQGIEFSDKQVAALLKDAKKQNKMIFIDMYTVWCGPCKHMAKNVFTQPEAGAYYNEHFNKLKLDAEKEGKEFAKKYNVTAYPTFLFINGDGELVYRFMGGRTVQQFVDEGKSASKAFAVLPQLKKMEKQYAKGKRNMEFLNDYYQLRQAAGLDCSEVLFSYIEKLDNQMLIDTSNMKRVDKITEYNEAVTERIVQVAATAASDSIYDRKSQREVNKAVNIHVSNVLKSASKQKDGVAFEAGLLQKDKYVAATGTKESITSASLGGGNIMLPSSLLR